MSSGTSPVITSSGESSVFAVATAVAMLQAPGPPIPIAAPEAAARPGIAIGHEHGAALVRRDHRRELVLAGERRHERIDQAAGNHEQVAETFFRQRVQDVVVPSFASDVAGAGEAVVGSVMVESSGSCDRP
jgi:hypothetical protein